MIRTFNDKLTEALHNGESVARFNTFEAVTRRKLDMLDGTAERVEIVDYH